MHVASCCGVFVCLDGDQQSAKLDELQFQHCKEMHGIPHDCGITIPQMPCFRHG